VRSRVRYAAAFTLSYACGLVALAAAVGGIPLYGYRINPHPLRLIAGVARQHATHLTR